MIQIILVFVSLSRFCLFTFSFFLLLLVQKDPLQRELATRLANVVHRLGGPLGEDGVVVVVVVLGV